MTPALRITRPVATPLPAASPSVKPAKAVESVVPPLLMSVVEVARELRTSAKTIQRMHRDGKLPAPVIVGTRTLRWCRATLVRWIALGSPSREEFERLIQQ